MPKTLMCDPRDLQKDLTGRVYIVTGANSGSGFATTKQLASQGATVIGACRRVDAGREAVAKMGSLSGSVEIMELDLGSLDSVRAFAEAFTAKYDRLDGLANNAGGMTTRYSTTPDGFEWSFGVNYLGPFLLTELLLDMLKASAPSRIACVSSVAHAGGRAGGGEGSVPDIHFDDLDWKKRDFSGTAAYGEAKLAVVLWASQLARRLDGTDVTAYSIHPGWIRSGFGRGIAPGVLGNIINSTMNVGLRPFSGRLGIVTPFEGAQTTLHCLLADDAPEHNGAYFSQISTLYADEKDYPGGWPMESPNPHAHDAELAEKLYLTSLELVGLGSDTAAA